MSVIGLDWTVAPRTSGGRRSEVEKEPPEAAGDMSAAEPPPKRAAMPVAAPRAAMSVVERRAYRARTQPNRRVTITVVSGAPQP